MNHTKIQHIILGSLLFALIFATAVNAHPGHGTPEIIGPEDTGGSTDTGGDSGASDNSGSTNTGGSTSTGASNSGDAASAQSSTSQSGGVNDAGDNSVGGIDDLVITSTSVTTYSSPGGPAALVGLIVVASLIIFNFPFKGGKLAKFQNIFGG